MTKGKISARRDHIGRAAKGMRQRMRIKGGGKVRKRTLKSRLSGSCRNDLKRRERLDKKKGFAV